MTEIMPEEIIATEEVKAELVEPIRMFEGKSFKRAESTEFSESEDRTLEFPFASEMPVERYFGMEVLSMDEKAMDLSRLNDGAPLLYQHLSLIHI